MSGTSEKCRRCAYSWRVNGIGGGVYCEYISATGHRRPCPAGDECRVYRTPAQRRADQRAGWDVERARYLACRGDTVEQIAAAVDKPVEEIRVWRKKEGGPG